MSGLGRVLLVIVARRISRTPEDERVSILVDGVAGVGMLDGALMILFPAAAMDAVDVEKRTGVHERDASRL